MPGFSRRKRRRAGGQVLLLAVLAMIILVIAVMVLFDVQRIIRGKIRVMSGIDAAALTGADADDGKFRCGYMDPGRKSLLSADPQAGQ